jgi:RND family efflux transporter MFP subunit
MTRVCLILTTLFLILAAAVLVGCSAPVEAAEQTAGTIPEYSDGPRRTSVRVVPVARTTFVEYGEYVGEARGVAEVRLTAATGGRVDRVTAEAGDQVSVGESLAHIDPNAAQTRYETAVLSERLARERWELEQRFLQLGNSFQLKVDQAHLAWLQARSALLDAQRMRQSAFAETPIAGTVVRRHIEPNDDLEPGDPTFDVADMQTMRITVGVPEHDITGVRELDEAEVLFPAIPGRTFAGTPTGFSRARSEQTLTYSVDIEVANPDGLILSGQTARVRLALHRHPEAITVPSAAVLTRNGETFVIVVRDEVARHVPVQVGVSDEAETVISAGLTPEDRIVAEGVNRLADGAPVEILE